MGTISSNLKVICLLVHTQSSIKDEDRLSELTRVCDLFFENIVESLSRGGSCQTQSISLTRFGGGGRDDFSGTAHTQVLACHAWLALSINSWSDEGAFNQNALEAIYSAHAQLLRDYSSSHKIKTTPLPLPLHLLVLLLKLAYILFIFPQVMAYTWVMKLSQHELRGRIILRDPAYIIAYAFTVALGITFLEALHLIAQQLDDPYGDDISDLPLRAIADSLSRDLETIALVSKRCSGDAPVFSPPEAVSAPPEAVLASSPVGYKREHAASPEAEPAWSPAGYKREHARGRSSLRKTEPAAAPVAARPFEADAETPPPPAYSAPRPPKESRSKSSRRKLAPEPANARPLDVADGYPADAYARPADVSAYLKTSYRPSYRPKKARSASLNLHAQAAAKSFDAWALRSDGGYPRRFEAENGRRDFAGNARGDALNKIL